MLNQRHKNKEILMRIKKINSSGFGVIIEDLDCSKPFSKPLAKKLKELLTEHQLLIFRKQNLSEDQYIRFGKYFGMSAFVPSPNNLETHPLITVVSNIKKNNKRIGLVAKENEFHAAGFDYSRVIKNIALYCKIASKKGGETLFADLRKAYNTLSSDMKDEVKDKHVLYEHFYEKMPDVSRPAVLINTKNRKRALAVFKLLAVGVKGMTKRAGVYWVKKIYKHIARPEHVYSHCYRKGDIIIWDNLSVFHSASKLPKSQRLLWRLETY